MTLLACAAVVALLVAAGSASAGSQGDAYNGPGWNGTRVSISGSGDPGTASIDWATVALQENSPASFNESTDGLFQVGEHTYSSGESDGCGTNSIGIVVERKSHGSSNYFCDKFFGVWGSNHRFAVIRVSSGWQAYEDGTVIDGPFSLGWSSGYSVARGEYIDLAPTSYSFTWGPSGSQAWQASSNSGSSYTTLLSSSTSANSGWTVGSAPTPFTIHR